jgi:hypothetical protein
VPEATTPRGPPTASWAGRRVLLSPGTGHRAGVGDLRGREGGSAPEQKWPKRHMLIFRKGDVTVGPRSTRWAAADLA